MLQIKMTNNFGVIESMAKLLGTKTINGYMAIPEKMGKGYIKGYMLSNSIGIMIRNYELNQDLKISRQADPSSPERVVMILNNIFQNDDTPNESLKNLPYVQIGKGKINFEIIHPSKTKFNSIIMAIEASVLKTLLGENEENHILKNILSVENPLLFEEILPPRILKVINELLEHDVAANLVPSYMRVKVEEIYCLLFSELMKRENTKVHALNQKDVTVLYKIRDRMIARLDSPPSLPELATQAAMSESKLKRLFKQIFGNSIFNYFQDMRMKEAARLLRENKYSVSEVGYKLGFTNLSHFSRVFEEYNGMTPKKYSMSL